MNHCSACVHHELAQLTPGAFAGTNRENILDAAHKGRLGRVYGERHWSCKLTEEQVGTIRHDLATKSSVSEIARRFGVTRRAVSEIIRCNTWKHLLPQAVREVPDAR